MLTLFAVPILAAVIGFALGYAAIHFKVEGNPLVEEISACCPMASVGTNVVFLGCNERQPPWPKAKQPNCCRRVARHWPRRWQPFWVLLWMREPW